ncbi:MAG: guanylate kinase [Proteobacteria bacterium]|nr:guanylate kinase [Pseudomonadota bacterium]
MSNDYSKFVLVVSGPSGSGKTSIIKNFLKENNDFELSISHTTRHKREGEIEGVNYYYISKDEFENKIKNGDFIEWAKIYDNYYGTSKKEIDRILKTEKNVLLEINIDGLLNAKNVFKEEIVSVFIITENIDELVKRLRERNSESEEDFLKRIKEVEREISYINFYDYVILNKKGKIEESVKALRNIAEAEKIRTKRLKNIKDRFFGGR